MLLDFGKIPAGGLILDQRLQLIGPASGALERLVRGPVRLVGHAQKGRRGVELEARLSATLSLECSRCLEPFEAPLQIEFFLIVVSEAAEFGPQEARLDRDDAVLFYADRGRIDLRDIAREQIDLNLPLKPVCDADCAGLCPTCGANRNRIECPCRPEDLDPRLAPLLDLKHPRDKE